MSFPPSPQTLKGGCHCGAVQFTVQVESLDVVECNCSICEKKGFLHLLVPPEQFQLLRGGDALTTYTFNTGTAKHLFCKTCGMHPFYHPRSHPGWYDVNLRCIDEPPFADILQQASLQPFNGKNWEAHIQELADAAPSADTQ